MPLSGFVKLYAYDYDNNASVHSDNASDHGDVAPDYRVTTANRIPTAFGSIAFPAPLQSPSFTSSPLFSAVVPRDRVTK
ncbi:uncharacterized protein BDR25DRAFT_351947 [Lindgomyces ingoldianus]|uniref:Uncharacterized protein n=1 Tax=Lindgomyces ingoldianus TaxID=673940 RepID=A0ACB6R5P0_9PLEO|nr:uncharacterized protein BDR25DRAFT_351947 [Lindgomyces ingoldianus]KAF2474405.1 hypothetical protein BDR25DRAFT_351947 [Lindgomyces ingoldianus]